MRFLLLKGKREAPVGTKHKWADGVYVKKEDHKWHKEKIHEITAQVLDKHKVKDKQLVEDFKDNLSHYLEFAVKRDLHPGSEQNADAFHRFWERHYEDKNWEEDDGYWKWAQAQHEALKKYREHLHEHGKKRADKPDHIVIHDPVNGAEVQRYQGMRGYTSEQVKADAENPVEDPWFATRFRGHTVEVGGEKGVLVKIAYQTTKVNHQNYETALGQTYSYDLKHTIEWHLITETGKKKVLFNGKIRILPDAEVPDEMEKASKLNTLEKVGVKAVVFDADIPITTQRAWERELQDAFSALGRKVKVDLKKVVTIRVHGKGGPGRNALADYSTHHKLIRLSIKKAGSADALAHELGHALDDKMNGWRGVDSNQIKEIVAAYRQTPQGMKERDMLSLTRRSWYRWATKSSEIFARCFETYVAHKVPSWEKKGYAKKAIEDESFKLVLPLIEKLVGSGEFKKALRFVVGVR